MAKAMAVIGSEAFRRRYRQAHAIVVEIAEGGVPPGAVERAFAAAAGGRD